MSEFMERARTEATGRWPLEVPPDEEIYTYPRRAIREHKNAAFVSGALWAVYQEPTDAEVEAAARALCDSAYGLDWPELVDGWKNKPYPDFPHLVDDLRDKALAALLAAQKVRAGQ